MVWLALTVVLIAIVAVTFTRGHTPLTLVTESDPAFGYLSHVSASKNGLTYLFSNERDHVGIIGFIDGSTNTDRRISVDLPIRIDPNAKPCELDRSIYFTAFPSQTTYERSQRGLYSTGLDDGKTRLIKLGVSANLLTIVNGRILFFTDDGSIQSTAHALWQSDGTEAGTSMLKDIEPTPKGKRRFSGFHSSGEVLLLERYESDDTGEQMAVVRNSQVWKSDGTPEGTKAVFSCDEEVDSFDVRRASMMNDRVFLPANTGEWGTEPWVTVLGSGERAMLHDIHPGRPSSSSNRFMVSLDAVYFSASHGETDEGRRSIMWLWKSDGTPEGTRRLTRLPSAGSIEWLAPDRGVLSFIHLVGPNADTIELWEMRPGEKDFSLTEVLMEDAGGGLKKGFTRVNGKVYLGVRNQIFLYRGVKAR